MALIPPNSESRVGIRRVRIRDILCAIVAAGVLLVLGRHLLERGRPAPVLMRPMPNGHDRVSLIRHQMDHSRGVVRLKDGRLAPLVRPDPIPWVGPDFGPDDVQGLE